MKIGVAIATTVLLWWISPLLVFGSNSNNDDDADGTCVSGGGDGCRSTDVGGQTKVGHNPIASPTLRIILIRHGESENNIHHEISREVYLKNRAPDPPLTAVGVQQAQETATYLKSAVNALLWPIDELYVSPVRRTLMTMQPIAKAIDMKPTVWTDIFEVGGIYETLAIGLGGMTKSELSREFPSYIIPDGTVTEDGWYNAAQGKETKEMGRARVDRVYKRLRQEAMDAKGDRTIALVVHGDFISFLIQAAWGIEGIERLFPCWNACISVMDINNKGEPKLLMHNAASHLSVVKTHALGKC